MFFLTCRSVVLLAAALLSASVQAGIVLNTTRVIYSGKDKEVSLGVHNTGNGEILVQSWLDSGPDEAAPGDVPFIVTPALARLPGDARQLLRIIHAGSEMPADRESVLWLSVQEIPQAAADNALQVAIRQRIKVFFRPVGLRGDALKSPDELRWQLANDGALQVENPGSYHVSMVRIEARQGRHSLLDKDSLMIAPGQRLELPLAQRPDGTAIDLGFISINDFGGQVPYRVTLKKGQAVQASRADRL